MSAALDVTPVSDGLSAAAVAVAAAEVDGEVAVATARAVYRLQACRAEIYARAYPAAGLRPDGSNAVCVAGTGPYGEQTEAVVLLGGADGQTPESVVRAEDAIMMCECNLCDFPEFRFDAGEPWRVATGGADSIDSYRGMKFGAYEKSIRECPPPCMAGLARMVHAGPVTKLYENAETGAQIFPMSKEEQAAHQQTRPDGKVVNLPRVLVEMRVFNPEKGAYEPADLMLTGAPADEAAELAWFDGVTRHLKSNLHGQPAADAAMLSFFETELLDNAQWKNQVAQMGENKWVRRFVEVKGSVGGGGGGAAAKK
jgi:hypothetical protein